MIAACRFTSLVAVFSATLPPSAAQAEANPVTDSLVESVVYTTVRPPNLDIYLFEKPRSEPRRLVDDPALDYNAVFSPDGRWVVFTSERTGSADLYALDLEADGEPIRITGHPAMDDAASFSPDGERLAFVSTRDGNADIFVMPFSPDDPGAEDRAVNLTRRPGGDFNPAFSPDGRRIAFSSQEHVFGSPVKSPAGAFSIENYGVELYLMDADGSNARRLTEPGPGPGTPTFRLPQVSGSPAWSLDGRAIYYYRIGREGAEIRRIAPDGSGDTSIVLSGLSPAVGPDDRIAFVQLPDPQVDLRNVPRSGVVVSVAADGSDPRAESHTLSHCFSPDLDRGSGQMLCYGPGPLAGVPVIDEGRAFAPGSAVRQVQLPDRSLEVRGIRGYFPAITPAGEVLWSPLHLDLYGQRLTLPLNASAIDGSGLRELFRPDSGVAWGAAVARDAGLVVLAVGPPFAGPEARVDIWKVRLDGADPVNLTADFQANDALPHISADGRRIVFRSARDGNMAVYVMDGEGKDAHRLTDTDARETMPALSPDGNWVVFPTDRADVRKLWLQRADGSDGRLLEPDRSDIPDISMHPRFSPDGEWVVFTSNRGGFNDEWPLTWYPQAYGELWAVPVAGGPAIRLTHNKWEDGPSDWGYVHLTVAHDARR